MDEIYYIISQNAPVLWFLLIVISLILIIYVVRIANRPKRTKFVEANVPTNLWFYLQLVDLEIGSQKASYKNLLESFIHFLCRRYGIKDDDLKKQTIFEIVKAKEDEQPLLDLYGDIWNSIDDLKQSSENEVIQYIKSIKHYFKKDNLDYWIREREREREKKPCNNC
jgi:hypothetical protein